MSHILSKTKITIDQSNSILAFESTGNTNWKVWDRFLTVEGKPAYHLGNVCGTCNFFFERLEGANRKISPTHVAKELRCGLTGLDIGLIEQVKLIMPKGEYIVSLLEVSPYQVALGTETDYFSTEQVELWGIDGFWGMPHNPMVPYYRSGNRRFEQNKAIFEFIIPMYPANWLNQKTVAQYKVRLEESRSPTALALSVLDVKQPANWDEGQGVTEHWCLAHYIIDGHHKILAAAEKSMPLTLLSFLSIKESIATEDNIKRLYDEMEGIHITTQ